MKMNGRTSREQLREKELKNGKKKFRCGSTDLLLDFSTGALAAQPAEE